MTLTRTALMLLKPLRRETKMKNLRKQTKRQTRKNLMTLMKTPRVQVA